IINGYSSFSINQLGETKIECFTDNPKFDSLLLLKFKEYKLTQPYKLGYKISASTSFLIFGAHGKSNIKITNGKIIKSSPAISDEILKYLIEEEIHKKFSTPLKTNVDSRYEVEYFIANINNVPDTGNNYIIKEYGSRNFTILFYGAILGFIGLVSILKL
ncbi:MAG TPA: hypothetical protein PKZ43_07200, partial [Bacteroidales bacterium]|nr:hypothetical protein [Bacteroidales bacterium]